MKVQMKEILYMSAISSEEDEDIGENFVAINIIIKN